MQVCKTGDKVAVHYRGRLSDGTVFDSSEGRTPLEFVLGSGMVIKGFDDGITGMTLGEKKEIFIPFVDAYGPHSEENTLTMPRTNLPPDLNAAVAEGMPLNMHQEDGSMIEVTVTKLTDTEITLDANHALAGKDLTFDIELVRIG
jgi:peptidylprolyl isomerase